MNKPSVHRQYLTRLTNYCLANKGLLAVVIGTGVLGFSVTFAFPWIIGSLIDDVIAPRAVNGVLPSFDARVHHLWRLAMLCSISAVIVAVAGYGRGHFNVKLGNRIVTMLRRDLFEHFQRLSLQFYSKERSGGIVWRLIHEVHGVNGLIHAGVILVLLDVINLFIAVG